MNRAAGGTRRERPWVKALVAAAVITGLATGGGVLTRRHYAAKSGSVPSALALEPSGVRRVVVTSKGASVELTRADDGAWTGGPGVPPATQTLIRTSEEDLFPLRGFRALSADAADPAFGLVDPEITLVVTDTSGREHRVAFGAPTFTEGGFYSGSAGEARLVNLVPKRVVFDLRSILAGHRIDPTNEVPQKVREIDDAAKARDEKEKVSYWLQQSLDSGTEVPEELK